MASKIKFVEGHVAYRNTWKNVHGNIRTGMYESRDRAVAAAQTSVSNLFQEIATPVFHEQCLLNPRIM